jgi:hypothetical protein
MSFTSLDWIVVCSYFMVLLGIPAWVARHRQQTACRE